MFVNTCNEKFRGEHAFIAYEFLEAKTRKPEPRETGGNQDTHDFLTTLRALADSPTLDLDNLAKEKNLETQDFPG